MCAFRIEKIQLFYCKNVQLFQVAKLISVLFMLPLQAIFKLTINNYLLNLSSVQREVYLIIKCQILLFFSFLFDKFPSYEFSFVFTGRNSKTRKPIETFQIEYKTNCVMYSTMGLNTKQEFNVLIGHRVLFVTFNLYQQHFQQMYSKQSKPQIKNSSKPVKRTNLLYVKH